MIQFKENARTGGRMDGRTDGQTLFYRTLPAMYVCNMYAMTLSHCMRILKFETYEQIEKDGKRIPFN